LRSAVLYGLIFILVFTFVSTTIGQEQEEEQFSELVRRGITLYREERIEEAVSVLEQAIAQDPQDATAYNALGVIKGQQGEFDAAMQMFDRAIALRTPYFKAIYNKLNLLISSQKIEEAEALLRSLVAEYPDHANGWINLAVLVGEQGDTDEALALLDRALQISPQDYDAHFKKGQLLVMLRRYEDALASLNNCLQFAPDYPPALRAKTVVEEIIEKKGQGYIRVRQIIVPSAELAQAVKRELDNGADFADLASRVTMDNVSKQFGGDLGFVKRGELISQIEDVIFDLQVGQVSDIVRSPRGFHIFKREE